MARRFALSAGSYLFAGGMQASFALERALFVTAHREYSLSTLGSSITFRCVHGLAHHIDDDSVPPREAQLSTGLPDAASPMACDLHRVAGTVLDGLHAVVKQPLNTP